MSRGKKLKKLHAWNAWLVLGLAVTGILLFLPSLRSFTASFRVPLKYFHIGLGVLSIGILLLYLPQAYRHWLQLKDKIDKKINLLVVILLIIGWSLSGMILWMEREVSPEWSSNALFWHDLLSLAGIPWAIYHSVTRSHRFKNILSGKQREREVQAEKSLKSTGTWFKEIPYSRRTFFRFSFGTILVLAIGPSFYRWLKASMDTGGIPKEKLLKTQVSDLYAPLKPMQESSPPIGGGAKGDFRIYTVTDIPKFQPATWKIAVNGRVEQPLELDWNSFAQFPRSVQVSDFHCVTGWSVYQVTWEGIPLNQLLQQAGIKPNTKFVKFYSGDGVYTDTLSLEQAMEEDVMVAALMDGTPIPDELGGPVRLIVPRMYAYKSVKWLQAIELIEEDQLGYWEVRGYDTNAWVRK